MCNGPFKGPLDLGYVNIRNKRQMAEDIAEELGLLLMETF